VGIVPAGHAPVKQIRRTISRKGARKVAGELRVNTTQARKVAATQQSFARPDPCCSRKNIRESGRFGGAGFGHDCV
jgi:hypothetical protein